MADDEKTTEETPEVEKLEEKVEETEAKVEEAKTSEYATKDDVNALTAMLEEFRNELKTAREKPKVAAPEKKEAPKPKVEEKKEAPKEETTPKVEQSYGSARWFNRPAKKVKKSDD